MCSRFRNPERWAVVARLRPIVVAAVLAVAANNAGGAIGKTLAQARVAWTQRGFRH